MVKKRSVTNVDRLLETIKKQPPEVAEALLKQLQEEARPGSQAVENLTGVTLTSRGGKVSVSDTTGKRVSIGGGKKAVFTPATLPREHITKEGDAVAPEAPAPASLLFLRLTAAERTTVVLDASSLYRSWARWGTMQLVIRTTDASGKARPSIVEKTSNRLEVAPGQTIEILGIGYAPRVDPASVFPTLAFGKFGAGGTL